MPQLAFLRDARELDGSFSHLQRYVVRDLYQPADKIMADLKIATFLFEGVGGAVVATVVGVGVTSWLERRKKNKVDSPILSTNYSSENSVVTGGDDSSISSSAIVQGSHNTIHINSAPSQSSQESWLEQLFTLGAILVFVGIILGAIYLMNKSTASSANPQPAMNEQHSGKSDQDETQTPKETSEVGLVFGTHAEVFNVFWDNNCTAPGITCLAESEISGKVVNISSANGLKRFRVGFTVGPTATMMPCNLTITTSDKQVSLEHTDQRDGLIHNKILLSSEIVNPVSEIGHPTPFFIDITSPTVQRRIPLHISVEGKTEYGFEFKREFIDTTLTIK